MSVFLELTDEEAFFTYHTLCTYLTGDYQPPMPWTGATKEDIRRVVSKIETGADGVRLSTSEANALAEGYKRAYRDTPLGFSFSEMRELGEKIYEIVPDEDRELYYGSDWPETRERALERDGYECRKCGISDGVHQQRRGYGLHVHHIQPLRTFDDPEDANCMLDSARL